MYCQNRRPSWVAAAAGPATLRTGLGGSWDGSSDAAAAGRSLSGVRYSAAMAAGGAVDRVRVLSGGVEGREEEARLE
jgi:hypothetical protein